MYIDKYSGGEKKMFRRTIIHNRNPHETYRQAYKYRITPLSESLSYFRSSHFFDNKIQSGNLSPNGFESKKSKRNLNRTNYEAVRMIMKHSKNLYKSQTIHFETMKNFDMIFL